MWMALLTRIGITLAFPFHALKRNIEMRPKDVAITTLDIPLIPVATALEAMAAGRASGGTLSVVARPRPEA